MTMMIMQYSAVQCSVVCSSSEKYSSEEVVKCNAVQCSAVVV